MKTLKPRFVNPDGGSLTREQGEEMLRQLRERPKSPVYVIHPMALSPFVPEGVKGKPWLWTRGIVDKAKRRLLRHWGA